MYNCGLVNAPSTFANISKHLNVFKDTVCSSRTRMYLGFALVTVGVRLFALLINSYAFETEQPLVRSAIPMNLR